MANRPARSAAVIAMMSSSDSSDEEDTSSNTSRNLASSTAAYRFHSRDNTSARNPVTPEKDRLRFVPQHDFLRYEHLRRLKYNYSKDNVKDVWTYNVQLPVNKNVETNLANVVRTHLFNYMKFTPHESKWDTKFRCFHSEEELQERHFFFLRNLILKKMFWDNYSLVDKAIMWNSYCKGVERVLGRCRSNALARIKAAVVPGKVTMIEFFFVKEI